MPNLPDDFFIQKVFLLETGVPGTVALRDDLTRLYQQSDDLTEFEARIDEFVKQLVAEKGSINGAIQTLFQQGFGIDLTTQKIEQLIADSLRQGINSEHEFFAYLINGLDPSIDKIIDNRAVAADAFTERLEELEQLKQAKKLDPDVVVDVNDPLVKEWINKVNGTDGSLQIARDTLDDLIAQLIPPILTNSNPPDDAPGVVVDADIVLTFSETVRAGTGVITINGIDIPITDSQVTISGNTVTINPANDLLPNTAYNIQMASEVITDLAGNPYVGISDSTTLNFQTTGNNPPIPGPPVAAAIAEDSGTLLITQAELLANASDTDGDPLAATGLAIATGIGALVDNGNGTWNYTPALNDDTAVSFSYTISDNRGGTVPGSASLDITPVNDNPTTSLVTLAPIDANSGARLITQAELLGNASDVDGDSLTATGLAIVAGIGTLVDNGNGTWNYTPALNDDTEVEFNYTVSDNNGGTAAGSAKLDITPVIINPPPIPGPPVTATIAEDSGTLLITQAGLLANASDPDGDPLTATGLAIVAGIGTLVDNGNGTWNYTPALNDDTAVSFSYTISDNRGGTVPGRASLDITPVNDNPTTSPVKLPSGSRVITQADLLVNASDVDGDSLTAIGLAIATGNGTLVDNGNGSWNYTPALNDDTEVAFNYTVSDNNGGTAAGSATLNITSVSILKIYVGLFNAAPGAANLAVLEGAINSGLSIAAIADLLGEHQFFQQIMAGKVTVEDQVAELMSHFGFVPGNSDPLSADAQTEVFFTAEINAGTSIGEMIFESVSFLSATPPPEFNEAAALLANKALVAEIYSRSNSSSDLATLQSILSDVTPEGPSSESEALSYLEGLGVDIDRTFPLLITADTITGTQNDEIFLGPIAATGNLQAGVAADTVQSEDSIDGGAGNDKALLELGATGPVVVNPEIKNVEVLDITSRSGDTLDMSRIAGVQGINSVSSTGTLSLTNVDEIIPLGLRNTSSAVTVNYSASLFSNEDLMDLGVVDADSTITINSAGSGSLEILTLESITSEDAEDLTNDIVLTGSALSGVSGLVLGGTGNLNLSTNGMNNLEVVDASDNAGGITVDLTSVNGNLAVTGGSGDDDFTAGNGSNTIDSGVGDDKVTFTSTTLDNLDTVNGSDGEDVFALVLGSSDISAISNNITNFEVLDVILPEDSSNSLDLSNLSNMGMVSLNISGKGNLNLLNAPSTVSEVDASAATGEIQLDLSSNVNNLSVEGGSGKDKIIGGLGVDIISGGSGADAFIFRTGTSGLELGKIDIVTDFTSGTDFLDFGGLDAEENRIFVDAGVAVNYASALDTANKEMAAAVASDSISPYVFADNATDGWVFYDKDSDGDADLSIQLTGVTSIVAADIAGVIFL